MKPWSYWSPRSRFSLLLGLTAPCISGMQEASAPGELRPRGWGHGGHYCIAPIGLGSGVTDLGLPLTRPRSSMGGVRPAARTNGHQKCKLSPKQSFCRQRCNPLSTSLQGTLTASWKAPFWCRSPSDSLSLPDDSPHTPRALLGPPAPRSLLRFDPAACIGHSSSSLSPSPPSLPGWPEQKSPPFWGKARHLPFLAQGFFSGGCREQELAAEPAACGWVWLGAKQSLSPMS